MREKVDREEGDRATMSNLEEHEFDCERGSLSHFDCTCWCHAERHVLDYSYSRIACSCGRWESGTWAEHQRDEGLAPPWPEPQTKAGRKLLNAVAGERADADAMGWWGARILAIEEEARATLAGDRAP